MLAQPSRPTPSLRLYAVLCCAALRCAALRCAVGCTTLQDCGAVHTIGLSAWSSSDLKHKDGVLGRLAPANHMRAHAYVCVCLYACLRACVHVCTHACTPRHNKLT